MLLMLCGIGLIYAYFVLLLHGSYVLSSSELVLFVFTGPSGPLGPGSRPTVSGRTERTDQTDGSDGRIARTGSDGRIAVYMQKVSPRLLRPVCGGGREHLTGKPFEVAGASPGPRVIHLALVNDLYIISGHR
jgi:hypothetical protein